MFNKNKLRGAVVAGGGIELRSAVVAGAAANTDIAVAGWKRHRSPMVIAAVNLTDGVDEQANAVAAAADGNVRFSVDTTAKKLLIVWAQRA
jgi:hypothetical protein